MAKAHKVIGIAPLRSYHENARIILPQKVEEVYTWECFIRDETRQEELHNMRISIKRLRYTLEVFRTAYTGQGTAAEKSSIIQNKRFLEFFAVVLDLQEILGDVHDSDVLLQVLKGTGHPEARPAVQRLIVRTEETRKADYRAFLRKWDHLSAAGFKEKFLSFLTA